MGWIQKNSSPRYASADAFGDWVDPLPSQLKLRGARSYFDCAQRVGPFPAALERHPQAGWWRQLRSWLLGSRR